MQTRGLIAANFQMDTELKSHFEKQLGGSVEVFYKETTRKKNVNSLGRHYGYFFSPLKHLLNGTGFNPSYSGNNSSVFTMNC